MVNVAIKKKISRIIEHRVSNSVNKNIRDLTWRKKYSLYRNPYSDILIHAFCLSKNIKSPVENNNSELFKYIKSFIEINKYKRINTYSLRPSLLLLKILIKRFQNCKLKKCFICYPLHKFIYEIKNFKTYYKLN